MQKISLISLVLISLLLSACTTTVAPAPLPADSGSTVTVPAVSSGETMATGGVDTSMSNTLSTVFVARGTEPFWIFSQTATGATYSIPDDISATGGILNLEYTTTQATVGTQLIVTATPVIAGTPIVLTITPGTCSDGMSDIVYISTVQLVIGTETRNGCAN